MSHPESVNPETVERASRTLAAEWLPGVEPEFVRTFSNHVYVLPKMPRLFLRITSGAHRSEPQLMSELQFVQFLASRGMPVSEPVLSRGGRLLHAVEMDGGTFYASAFREAPGLEFTELSPRGRRGFFRLAGRTMGRLHLEGRGFVRPNGFQRFHWLEDRWARFPEFIPENEREAWQVYEEILAWTRDLPRDSTLFGLIHGDFTILNMRIRNERITLFDFDSCCEHWYGYEIATFLHYFGGQENATRKEAFTEVLRGYEEAAGIDNRTVAAIPLFGRMRLLYSFLVFAGAWGFENLSSEQAAYFALRRRLLTEDSPWPPS